MKRLQLLCLCALIMSLPAVAQWQWIDPQGRKVFSDRPPPVDVPQKNILKQPGTRLPSADLPTSAPVTPTTPSGAASATGGEDKELTAKKKQAAEAEAAKRRQDEEKMARIQAENCERATRAKNALEAGQRTSRLNDKGEREFLDDAGRAAELQRLQGIIDDSCK